MSEILSNIVIEQTNINFSPDNNNINITPEPTQLNIFTGGLAVPGGNIGELQYNNGTLAGIPFATYTAGNLNLGNVSNIKITGGANNYILKTDGTGNLTWGVSGSVGNSSQGQLLYNDANVATGVANTSVASGTLTFTNLANLKIDGGTNGYVLQTDGTGNLTWTAQTGGSGNGVPGGSNTQIQYNDSGNFGGSAGFTFNEISNVVNMPGNLNIVGTYIGNGSGLTAITGANVTGTVANATYAANAGNATNATIANSANTAGTVTTASQPNITSVGTLVSLNVSGNISAANVIANPGAFYGNGSGLSNLTGANITGQVGNALVAGTVYTNAQPNITSVGTLISLSVTGNIDTTGTTTIQQAKEKVTLNASPATATVNYDLLDQAILFKTANASGSFVINFRGNSTTSLDSVMSNNQSMTCTFINTNGSNAYVPTSIAIDGFTRNVAWAFGLVPSAGTVGGKDVYNFNIIKTTTNTYTVLGSYAGYY